jgi:enamine deaminase RidA (YjgF/YER057c/UK114 family)
MRLLGTLALVTATITMAFAQSSKQIISTGGNPNLPFSPAVKAGDFIYVAGTLGTNASGALAKATSRRRPGKPSTTSRRR